MKLGGSAITNKDVNFSIKEEVLGRIAEELASIKKKLVLVHGGGSFGHPLALEHDIASGYSEDEQIMGFSETHQAMEELNSKVVRSLLEAGRAAMSMQTSACSVVEEDEIVSIELRNIQKILDLNIIPVLYGDAVPDLKKGMTILSGDQLTAALAQELGVSKVVWGMDTDGVYTKDPKYEDAEFIPKITPESWEEISSSVDLSHSGDVTGGMRNKMEVLLSLAREGIDSQVVNATKPGNLSMAIGSDKRVGTKIVRE